MKKKLLLLLLLLPALASAQLGEDGKTKTASITKSRSAEQMNSSILYSGSTCSPFGLKYIYAQTHGAYLTFKTDFDLFKLNHNLLTAGYAYRMAGGHDLYFGAGVDLAVDEDWDEDFTYSKSPGPVIEGGIVFHYASLALELGLGTSIYYYQEYNNSTHSGGHEAYTPLPYLTFGIGFSF